MDENNQIIYGIAKIYRIKNNNGDVYIGRTTLTLNKRLGLHKTFFKQYKKAIDAGLYVKRISSVVIFENLQENEKAVIELIENFQYNTAQELYQREGYHIREHLKNNQHCVNVRVSGRTSKQFYMENLGLYQQKNAMYYQLNKDRLKQKRNDRINAVINIEAL